VSREYRVSKGRYLETLEAQGGVCAICCRGPAEALECDHCHKTEKVRALLCHSCNKGLGFFQDDPALLRVAALYIEQRSR
jgi:hypothetical protein